MNPGRGTKLVACSRANAHARLVSARAFLNTAELVATENVAGMANVAASLSVLAAIAASDAICGAKLGQRYRGPEHASALELLRLATPGESKPAATFQRVIALKDDAHYGVIVVPADQVRTSLRQASALVRRAEECFVGGSSK